MKFLPSLYTGLLLLLLQNYSCADNLWDCYYWTAQDKDLINARGGAGNYGVERKVCETIRGHLFTGGLDRLAPGCGRCWCCRKPETRWKCHQWTENELSQIKALGGNKEAERHVCDARRDFVFTAGENSLAPGCGSCWCCEKI